MLKKFFAFIASVSMLLLLEVSAFAYDTINVNVDIGSSQISVSGSMGTEAAGRELIMTVVQEDKTISDITVEPDTDGFTDLISGFYQTSSDADGNYSFDTFVNGSKSGRYKITVTADNGISQESINFLPSDGWAEGLKNEISLSDAKAVCDMFEREKDNLIEISDIFEYYSLESQEKEEICEFIKQTSSYGSLEEIFDKMETAVIEKYILTTKSAEGLKKYIITQNSGFSEKYISAIEKILNIENKKENSAIKYFLGCDSASQTDILENAVRIEKLSINDFYDALYLSVITYRMKNVDNWSEIFSIIKESQDVLTDLNFVKYQQCPSRSTIDKQLPKMTFNSLGELCKYINDKVNSAGNTTTGGGNTGGCSSSFGKGTNGISSATTVIGSQNTADKTESSEQFVFNDMDSCSWAKPAVKYLYDKKIVSGDGSGKFNPYANVTREEFVKMLVLAMNIDINTECDFEDISVNDWAYRYIAGAVKAGIVNGINDNTFGKGMYISREDMAVMTARAVFENESVEEETDFVDFSRIADYARESVKIMNKYGIINGFDDSTFRPKDSCNRAQAAMVIYNIMQAGGFNG